MNNIFKVTSFIISSTHDIAKIGTIHNFMYLTASTDLLLSLPQQLYPPVQRKQEKEVKTK